MYGCNDTWKYEINILTSLGFSISLTNDGLHIVFIFISIFVNKFGDGLLFCVCGKALKG